MTKHEIASRVAKRIGGDRNGVIYIMDEVFETMRDALCQGKTVTIRRFATFYPKHAKAKKGWLIGKRQSIDIPERYVPRAKFCPEIQEAIKVLPVKKEAR